MATLSAPVDTAKSDKRRISNGTLCSSNSSCVLQKRKQLHPLACAVKYTNKSNSTIKQRVLSAKYLRFKTLQNELNDANFHIAQLINENKILKNLQRRQEHALARYEGTNAEIPKIIESHQEEIRVLQAKIKNLRKNIRDLNDQMKSKDDELNILRDQNKHLLNLCRNKNLDEREKLSKKVEDLEDMIRQRDNTISTLNRKIVLETKNCKFKIAAEVTKNKNIQKELQKALLNIEELNIMIEGKEVGTDRKSTRNTSKDRQKSVTKLREKVGSSGKKSSGKNSTSSLVLSEENESCELNISDDKIPQTETNDSKNNNEKIQSPTTQRDNYSSELQLKNVVNSWQKKNVQENLKQNLNEYSLDIIESAENCTKIVDKHTLDFENSEQDMQSILYTLKETDELNKKFNRVSVSSPVLDFTDLFKNKDKNSNVNNKLNKNKMFSETRGRKNSISNGVSSSEEIDMAEKHLESNLVSTYDLNEDVVEKDKSKISFESDVNDIFNTDQINVSKNHSISNFERRDIDTFDLDEFITKSENKINFKKNGNVEFDIDELRERRNYNELNINYNGNSRLDLDEYDSAQNSQRSNKSEVGNEDKEKLLAKLRAIDNGENIEFTGVQKTKNDLLKELFG